MDQNPPVNDPGPVTRENALEKVLALSVSQAHEIWHAMQLIATNGSLEGLPRPVVQVAMELNDFLNAWKVVAEKAVIHERLIGKPRRRGLWFDNHG
jgi:hypothetical protein